MLQYVRREKPWLLVLGRIGVHSDEDMDIGSNTENLLRLAPCNVLLSSRRYVPAIDVRAEETMTWTEPATSLVNRAPEFARGVARTTIHRWAMERGHSVITTKIVEEAMATILPKSAMQAMGIIAENIALESIDFDKTDTYVCSGCGYAARGFQPTVCGVCNAPAEKFMKLDKEAIANLVPLEGGVEEEQTFDNVTLKWTPDAREALRTLPQGYQRRRAKAQVEKKSRVKRLPIITKDLVLDVIGDTREVTKDLQEKGELKKTAIVADTLVPGGDELVRDGKFSWTAEALTRLKRVPEGFMRNITKSRIEDCATTKGVELITLAVVEEGIAFGRKLMEEMINDYKKQGRVS
jgi:rubrerythrin